MSLDDWELKFDFALRNIIANQRGKAGVVLPVVPVREEWEKFVAAVRTEWWHWEWTFTLKPGCMVALYDGAAFYNYRSGAFWNDFAGVLGLNAIPVNIQTSINHHYARAASQFGLRVNHGNFVGSAVAHIGIPISMWDAFLQICEWALWTEGWDSLSDEAWHGAMSRRLGGHIRLINFLVDNRDTARQFVREMLEARRLLASDRTVTLSQVAQLLFLRAEYFDEVPETADFLRPEYPESLFADRGRLAWTEERRMISLYLPPVQNALLPATWRLGATERPATTTACEMVLNGQAFSPMLRLELSSPEGITPQRIDGIDVWALYDETHARFVNRKREFLPVSQYVLISRQPLNPQLEGWSRDPDDPAIDVESQLADGTAVFLTKLLPKVSRPRLKIGNEGWLKFAQRRGVELRVFCGDTQQKAARFSVLPDDTVRTETWPQPFLEVPLSLVPDENIPSEFTVYLDGQPARGKWTLCGFDPRQADENTAERAYYFWKWDESPIPLSPTQPVVQRSLSNLDTRALQPVEPNVLGRHALHVESRKLGRLAFGLLRECRFELVATTPDSLWPASWGDYIAWVFLAQAQDAATWEEVRIAREAVAGYAEINLNAVYHQIRKLEHQGYLVVRGHRYQNFLSRIVLADAPNGAFRGEYCGLTSTLYEVARRIRPLRITVALSKPGYPAKLFIDWSQRDRQEVRNVCQALRIEIGPKLW